MDNPANYRCDSMIVRVSSREGYDYSTVVKKADYATPLCVFVPARRLLNVDVMDYKSSKEFNYTLSGDSRIPLGHQCPRTLMHCASVDIPGEYAVDSVRLYKNYCSVSLDLITDDSKKYKLSVIGNVCGYSVDGYPIGGDFNYQPVISEKASCNFCLPRQLDSSLELGISSDGGTMRRFALGNYIEESGYDWAKPDLEDIAIVVDYSTVFVTIQVNGWEIVEMDVVL